MLGQSVATRLTLHGICRTVRLMVVGVLGLSLSATSLSVLSGCTSEARLRQLYKREGKHDS